MGRTETTAFLEEFKNKVHFTCQNPKRLYLSMGSQLFDKTLKLLLLLNVIVTFRLNAEQFMDVSEIKPGMLGIGKTVFSQTKIEDFKVEIIDVMKNVSPRGDVILARLSGGSIPGGLENTGVIAGMSGSPVYINGKMIGAIAYTWSYQKEPIAGITPIREMLDIIEVDKHSQASPENEQFQFGLNPGLGHGSKLNQNSLSYIPIPVAFSSSALSEHPELLESALGGLRLTGYGILPVFAAGTSSDTTTVELEPGSAVGVSLIQGDMQSAGIGTLTYRDKDKILAFGHPMFLSGTTEFPMVGGIIHTIMPSQALSFKLFSPTKSVGIVTQDRANGIMGKIGKTAKLIPIKVAIHSLGVDTFFSYAAVDHKLLFPGLLSAVILNSIAAKEGIFGASTIKADMTLALKVGEAVPQTIKLQSLMSGDAPAGDIVDQLAGLVASLIENEFEPVKIEDVKINLDIEPGKKTSYLEKLIVDKEKIKPGDSIEVTIVLRTYQGKMNNKKVTLQIPPETPAGNLVLLAANADSTYLMEFSRAPDRFAPINFNQLVEQIQKLGRGNVIQVSGYVQQRGVVVQAQELPNPPPFIKQVLARPKNAVSFTESNLILRQSLTAEEMVQGVASLNLIVERE
jgi:hypothetical protein